MLFFLSQRTALTQSDNMSINDCSTSLLAKAQKFQMDLLNSFPRRKEAILQLIEALASTIKPTSAVELSQAGPFQRTYSNVHKAIDSLSAAAEIKEGMSLKNEPSVTVVDADRFLTQTRRWTNIFACLLPQEIKRPFKLFAIDATSDPRPHAQTLEDRTFVHQAAQLGSSVTIGLRASVLVAIPEKVDGEAKWTLPLSVERIPSSETPCETAARQLIELHRLWPDSLCVVTADSGYTSLVSHSANQVLIMRGRIDRTGRRPHNSKKEKRAKRGRPRKYEDPVLHFANNVPIGDEGGPDEETEHESICNGRQAFVLISRWNGVHIHGQPELVDVVKCEIFLKEDTSRTLFAKPLLLIVSGQRRQELTGLQVYESYLSRFDIEHFFRFQKQQLLFSGYQTPELQRQINWWWICLMAYWLLYLVRAMAPESNRPWMPKRRPNMTASPGEVKRVFGLNIFPDLGSPSRKPLTRGKSKGRAKGTTFVKRMRKKPIKKMREPPNYLAA
jgi:hypothetical protein